MRQETVLIQRFEPGDRVCTPDGEGIILFSKVEFDQDGFYRNQEVIIQLDESNSNNTSNQPIRIDVDAYGCIYIY